ncbi:MAG: isopentenyl-diphosphate delta-isomerase [Pseudomonadota bacterium]
MSIHIPTWVNGILQPVEKLEAHQKGLKHKAISVFLVRDGHTLLQRRALGKYHTPGLWANACCTHPYWDEDSLTCAERRLEEELGIRGLDLMFRDTVEYRADVGNDLIEHEIVDLFFGQLAQDFEYTLNSDEVDSIKWVQIHALPDLVRRNPEEFTPWLRIYVDQFSDLIFGKELV